jgi:hypothetical protein
MLEVLVALLLLGISAMGMAMLLVSTLSRWRNCWRRCRHAAVSYARLLAATGLTQLTRQREYHVLLTPGQLGRQFGAPATEPLHHLLHQQLGS